MLYICSVKMTTTVVENDIKIVPLCNGSTADFGSVSQGSNPCGTTNMKRGLAAGKLQGFFFSVFEIMPKWWNR